MKHQPIFNPHARIGQIVKKTKTEEKDELIQTTKANVLEKYGATRQKSKKAGTTATQNQGAFEDNSGFQLEEKVDKMYVGIKLLKEGFMQAYIDFFYLTNGTTPSQIQPSERLLEEQKLNKQVKTVLEQTPAMLTRVSETLQDGELYWRDRAAQDCFRTYASMAEMYEGYNDYETASYFHQRCLDISIEFKYIEGEAKAHRGLGICEEKVFNKFEAMQHLETALEKASNGELVDATREISKDLVRVYQQIANEYLEMNDFELSLQFFEKCLDVSRKAKDRTIEAECYQQIGMIYETQGELDKSIEYRMRFLQLCKETKDKKKEGQAHKQLAETYSKANDIGAAINHLTSVLDLALEEPIDTMAQAEAALKLGLLFYKDGEKKNIKRSAEYLQNHFTLIRHNEEKNQRQIDRARVNLGIVKANQQIKAYQYMITNPDKLQDLVEWKVCRDQKNLN